MAQPSSYGPSTNSALSGVVHQDHISQPQSTEMLTYNSNSTSSNNNMVVGVETASGDITFNASNNTTSIQVSSNTNQLPTSAGAINKEGKSVKTVKQQQPRKPPPTIETFWPTILHEVQHTAMVDSKHQSLPLARIKKIMKLDENAKMIAAEAPLLFAKACEFFIQELTMRAWIHTDESKRRTLQRSDIAQAIANYDQFDFLIDIVPREDIKPPSHRRTHQNDTSTSFNNATGSTNPATTTPTSNVTGEMLNASTVPLDNIPGSASVNTAQPSAATIAGAVSQQQQPAQVITTSQPTQQLQIIQQAAHPQQQLQYFITLPGQQNSQTQLVHQLQLQQQQQQQHLNNSMGTPLTAASLNLVAQHPHQLILTAANPTGGQANMVQQQQQAALLQNLAQQQQQVQFLQHVVLTPNGELTNMPIAINANQLQLLRLQMQQQQQQQQQHHQIIPTHLLTAQQILQLQAAQQNNNATTTHVVHQQPQQQQTQQQQHPQTQTNTNNIYINSNPATASQASSGSMVSTDRNLGSTFRNNC